MEEGAGGEVVASLWSTAAAFAVPLTAVETWPDGVGPGLGVLEGMTVGEEAGRSCWSTFALVSISDLAVTVSRADECKGTGLSREKAIAAFSISAGTLVDSGGVEPEARRDGEDLLVALDSICGLVLVLRNKLRNQY
jgi:hypothetical protein